MTTKLNKSAFAYARELVYQGRFAFDEMDAWSEDQPTPEQENEFIRANGFDDYMKWYLGIEDDAAEDTKARYKFPYGDFRNVHRCGVISAESRAGQYKHDDIEKAARQLREMIDEAHAVATKRHG